MSEFELRIAHGLLELLLTLLFFRAVKPTSGVSRTRRWGGIAVLLLLMPMYHLGSGLIVACVRYAWRIVVYVMYLHIAKGIELAHAGYLSLLVSTFFLAANNIMVSPIFHQVQSDVPTLTPWPFLDDLLVLCLLKYAVVGMILAVAYGLVPLDNVGHATPERIGTIAIVVCVELYTKEAVHQLASQGVNAADMQITVFVSLLDVFMMLFLILMERAFCTRDTQEAAKLREVAMFYQIEGMRARLAADEDMRAFRHDMKNHIIALHQLAADADDQRVAAYVDTLNDQLDVATPCFQTGRSALDGLLAVKAQEATQIDARIEIALEPGMPSRMISDADLCVIFGNLLDNALEAMRAVPQGERIVNLRGRCRAGVYVAVVENPYAGNMSDEADLPATTKPGRGVHGYGLRNVRDAMARNGGTMQLQLDNPSVFRVVLTFSPS